MASATDLARVIHGITGKAPHITLYPFDDGTWQAEGGNRRTRLRFATAEDALDDLLVQLTEGVAERLEATAQAARGLLTKEEFDEAVRDKKGDEEAQPTR